ncbi:hypothetical protein [Candidatus Borreliella tachyglossi]|uniref:hypothetical protein n=1 Tax=Candidatus Borreliella tachyglossi TaxID=1964448 RepID=UPI00131F06AB|nr:hypothetical protein [Candidatus Borreliella tachyglossi]
MVLVLLEKKKKSGTSLEMVLQKDNLGTVTMARDYGLALNGQVETDGSVILTDRDSFQNTVKGELKKV